MRMMLSQLKQIVLCPPLPKTLMRSDLLLERFALLVFEGHPLSAVTETRCQSGETELEGHEHTVQLLEKGGDSTQLPAMLETDDTTTESCQQRKFLGLSAVADVQWNSSSLGKGQRRNFSSMTQVFSMIFAAAQHLDSSCTDCWNQAVRFGCPDLLEFCANSDSPLVEAVESAGGEGLRTSVWNGHDLTISVVANVFTCLVQRKGQDTCGSHLLVKSLEHHHNVTLETKFTTWYVRQKDEVSCQRLCLGSARFPRMSTEPILASFDHFSRCSASFESSNL